MSNSKYKNILITGGAGFIGSNLALKLIQSGATITILDNLSPQIHGENPETDSPIYQSIKDKVNFILGSVTSYDDCLKAIEGQDAIIHLAAETGTGQSMYEIQRYADVNVGGTAIILDILANKKHNVKKILVASSRAIYGEGKYRCITDGIVYPVARIDSDLKNADFSCKCPLCGKTVELLATDEESKIHPTSVYGITKQNQEQMFLEVGKALNIPAVAFRYQNVYGPGQSLSNPYTGILSIFSTRILNGNKINIFEDGKESRDFVYIDDVVDATILGLNNDNANFEAFNVGTGERTDVLTVANTLIKHYSKSVDIEITGNYRLGDIRDNYADMEKTKKLIGFEPKVSFETGLKYFTDWVKGQSLKSDNYDESIRIMKEKGLYK